MRRFTLILAVAFLCLGSPANIAFAVDYFVNSATGSDSNDGLSDGQAFATISMATGAASDGDRIFVRAGNGYNRGTDKFPILVPQGVEIVGSGAGVTVVDTTDNVAELGCQPVFEIGSPQGPPDNPTIIRDLTAIASSCASEVIRIGLPQRDVRILDNEIMGARFGVDAGRPRLRVTDEIGLGYSTSSFLVSGNDISGFTATGVRWNQYESGAPELTSVNVTIQDNEIMGQPPQLTGLGGDGGGDGIQVEYENSNIDLALLGTGATINTVVNGNTVSMVGSDGIRVNVIARGNSATLSFSHEIKNNDIRDVGSDGIHVGAIAEQSGFVTGTASICSNICTSAGSDGIDLFATAPFSTGGTTESIIPLGPGPQGGGQAGLDGVLANNTTVNNNDHGIEITAWALANFLGLEQPAGAAPDGPGIGGAGIALMDWCVQFNDCSQNSIGLGLYEEGSAGTAEVTGKVTGNFFANNAGPGVRIIKGSGNNASVLGEGDAPDFGGGSELPGEYGRNTFRETDDDSGSRGRVGPGVVTIEYDHPGPLYAQGNWWGSTDPAEIRSTIIDGYLTFFEPRGNTGVVDITCPLNDPIEFTPSVVSGTPGSVAGVTALEKSNFVGQIGVKDCDEGNEGRDMMLTLGGVPVPICNITVEEEQNPLGVFQPGSFLQFIIPFGVPGGPQPLVIMNAGDQMGMTMVNVRSGLGVIDASRCFIATAAFGDENASAVRVLRRWRDECLSSNALGRQLVKAYYAISPGLAETIADSDAARGLTRAMLAPVVGAVKLWLDLPWLYGLAGAALLLRLLRRNKA